MSCGKWKQRENEYICIEFMSTFLFITYDSLNSFWEILVTFWIYFLSPVQLCSHPSPLCFYSQIFFFSLHYRPKMCFKCIVLNSWFLKPVKIRGINMHLYCLSDRTFRTRELPVFLVSWLCLQQIFSFLFILDCLYFAFIF